MFLLNTYQVLESVEFKDYLKHSLRLDLSTRTSIQPWVSVLLKHLRFYWLMVVARPPSGPGICLVSVSTESPQFYVYLPLRTAMHATLTV